MNKNRKRMGAFFLALAMMIATLPMNTLAADGRAFNCNLTGITKDRIDIGGAWRQ